MANTADEKCRDSNNPVLANTIAALFHPVKVDPSAPSFVDPTGKHYENKQVSWKHPLGSKPKWTEPLGKKVLIVDIDTRKPTGDNQIFNPAKLDWKHLEMKGGGLVSNAIMNHYLYAMIHGYDYKFYQAQQLEGHFATWIRPHIFRELIDDYQFVIALDADVTLSHLEVPLEWMFNRWGVTEKTSMAMPYDTEEWRDGKSVSQDSKGQLVLNGGVIMVQNSVMAQNSTQTQELLEAWRDCTTEKRYPGCGQWKQKWSHEQRAFSEYVRYDYNKDPENIVAIPCDDAMGWPGFHADVTDPKNLDKYNIADCNGNFIRHYTLGKDQVKEATSTGIMQMLSELVQKNIFENPDAHWYKEPPKNEKREVLEGEQ